MTRALMTRLPLQLRLAALRVFPALLLAAVSATAWAQGTGATVAEIDTALQAGEADKAIGLIASLPENGANQAAAQNLECRVRFTLQQWDTAAGECEQAVRLDSGNSGYHLWLGRALGERADRASFLSAFSLGKRVRSEFEEAVKLDPRNAPALSDLGEFYREAPGVVGGGLDKAESVAAELDKVDPARAHQLRAGIAETRKDDATAERELKQAVESSHHPASQWTVLASFYEHRQRWPEMEEAIHNCASAAARDRTAGVALYDGAGILIRAKRDPALAAKMLGDYLAGESKTEEAPAFIAHYRLARLLEQLGDSAGAQRERAAGYAMAHEYHPPPDSKH
jgi:tetratricopeptide (TPR) repeat protein